MARTIADIQNSLIIQVQGDPVLKDQLTSTSRVALWRLFTYVIAVCQWTLENLYDLFVAMVEGIIANMKPHTARWYQQKALAFQFGFYLPADTDTYDNTGIFPEQIAAAQVVKYAAVIEQVINNRNVLRMKVATIVSDDLAPVPSDQLTAFVAYMARIKDAGVKLIITTGVADSLQLNIDFYYDPLLLNSTGGRNDGTDPTPVQTAVKSFLKSLPFNGVFSLNKLEDALQAVPGYKECRINYALTQYGALPFTAVNVVYIPDSGYLRFANPDDLTINFIVSNE